MIIIKVDSPLSLGFVPENLFPAFKKNTWVNGLGGW
jgi:hypothetical protein